MGVGLQSKRQRRNRMIDNDSEEDTKPAISHTVHGHEPHGICMTTEHDGAATPSSMAQAEPCRISALRLHTIEIEGFKSYRHGCKAVVGPLTDFSCVVGPNGAGKSVVGEAIAFVLGGNIAMLRVNSFASLLNHQDDTPTAAVTLAFRTTIMEGEHTLSGTLSVRKEIIKNRCVLSTRDGENECSWQTVDQAWLDRRLTQFGLHSHFLHRYIVMQQKSAVMAAMQYPPALAEYLESLIGSDGCKHRIAATTQHISRALSTLDDIEDEAAKLEQRRVHLAPEVAKWRQLEADKGILEQERGHFLHLWKTNLEEQVSMAEQEFLQCEATCQAAEYEEGKLLTEVEEVCLKKTSHQTHLSEVASDRTKYAQKAAKLCKKQAKMAVQLAEAKQQKARCEAAIKEVQLQADALQKELATARELLQSAATQRADIKADMSAAARRHADASTVVASSSEAVMQRAERLKLEMEQRKAELATQTAAYTAQALEVERWQSILKMVTRALAQSESAIAFINAEEIKLQDELAALQNSKSVLDAMMAEQQAKCVQLQKRHSNTQARLAAAQQLQHIHDAPTSATSAGNQKFDGAVDKLLKMSDHGALPGRFYGRLQDVARVADPGRLVAINAVLSELCNMNASLVVSDREAATHVLRHFQTNCVGVATCIIISELKKTAGNARTNGNLMSALDICEGLERVFEQMFASWMLVEDSAAAVKMASGGSGQRRPFDIVTLQLFKADGEVVGYGMSPQQQPYLLSSHFGKQAMVLQPEAAGNISAEDVDSMKAALQSVIKERDQAEVLLKNARADLQIIKSHLTELQKASGSSQQHQRRINLEQDVANKRRELESAHIHLTSARAALPKAALAQELEQQVQLCQAQFEAASGELEGGAELVDAECHLKSLRLQLHAAEGEHQAARDNVARIQRRLHKQTVKAQDKVKMPDMKELSSRAATLAKDIQYAKTAQTAAEQALAAGEKQHKALDASLRQAIRARDKATKHSNALQDQMSDIKAQLQVLRQKLAKVTADMDTCSSGQNHQPEIGPSSPSQSRQAVRLPRTRHRHKRAKLSKKQMRSSEIEQDWDEINDEFAAEAQRLEERQAQLDSGVLDADSECAIQLKAAGAALVSTQAQLERLQKEKEAQEIERYERFDGAMKSVNSQLSSSYHALTGQQGTAFCSYTQQRHMCFIDGITLHVRPDRHRWRPVSSLSGGQQAMVSLALSFSLQAAFPSTFYFFDEVDCALDTANASRVAEYIKAQKGAQYCVVSHKPQVYEKASCLVGVYTVNNSSAVVTFHPPINTETPQPAAIRANVS